MSIIEAHVTWSRVGHYLCDFEVDGNLSHDRHTLKHRYVSDGLV